MWESYWQCNAEVYKSSKEWKQSWLYQNPGIHYQSPSKTASCIWRHHFLHWIVEKQANAFPEALRKDCRLPSPWWKSLVVIWWKTHHIPWWSISSRLLWWAYVATVLSDNIREASYTSKGDLEQMHWRATVWKITTSCLESETVWRWKTYKSFEKWR